ncbi:hypothetical protein RND81_04G148400 [Saponaria officinalis]|uniref:Peroxidase n=1 Tax=Saponaria officinalis TaxID=3572 RepID=A0AAW1LM57_SAPOF
MMKMQTFPKLVMHMLLALGLILVSSQVGLSQSPVPAPAPAPGPGYGDYTPSSGLEVGFYIGKCEVDVEALIADAIEKVFYKDPTILPAMLRLQFHDCFVNGCEASILISGNLTEKAAGPNGSVRGYEVIDAIKEAIEAKCPDVVSCADIIVVSTATLLHLGGGPVYTPETGRRDGLESNVLDVDLPSPTMSVQESIAFFVARGFTAREMVALLGCHSVGITHCPIFEDRLYEDSASYDASMDQKLRRQLTRLCPKDAMSNNITPLNQDRANKNTVDNTLYGQLLLKRGILQLDQALSSDPETSDIVREYARNPTSFHTDLALAIKKLQAFEVLTGDQGEIRKVCSKIN